MTTRAVRGRLRRPRRGGGRGGDADQGGPLHGAANADRRPARGGGAAPDEAAGRRARAGVMRRSTPVGFGAPDWPPPSGDGRGACSASTDLQRARHAPPGGSGPPTVSARKGAEGWTRAVVRHPTAPPPRAAAASGAATRARRRAGILTATCRSSPKDAAMGAGVRPTGRSRRPAGPSGESSSLGRSPTVSSARRS